MRQPRLFHPKTRSLFSPDSTGASIPEQTRTKLTKNSTPSAKNGNAIFFRFEHRLYFLEGALPAAILPFLQSVLDIECNLSIITKIELLGWQFPSAEKEADATDFINASTIYGLTDDIANQTISIRKSVKIKLPDAVIAATALIHGLELISRNEADFKKIPGLVLVNPFAIWFRLGWHKRHLKNDIFGIQYCVFQKYPIILEWHSKNIWPVKANTTYLLKPTRNFRCVFRQRNNFGRHNRIFTPSKLI